MADTVVVLVNRPSPFWLPPVFKTLEGGARQPIAGKLLLRPGTNTVPRKRWELSKDHPAIQRYLDVETLKVDPTPEEKTAHAHAPDSMTGLRDMTVVKATVWIEACKDGDQLLAWRNGDTRKGIHAAIDARLAELADDVEEDVEEEDGD